MGAYTKRLGNCDEWMVLVTGGINCYYWNEGFWAWKCVRMMIDFVRRWRVWFSQSRRWNPSGVAMLKRLALGLCSSLVMWLARIYLLKLKPVHLSSR